MILIRKRDFCLRPRKAVFRVEKPEESRSRAVFHATRPPRAFLAHLAHDRTNDSFHVFDLLLDTCVFGAFLVSIA
jgi:hypothetical protein